jgi:FAD/FMN-containing dehydrogenase
MRENVHGVTAVRADAQGTVFHTGTRARKSSAGYDLTRLLVGSEGTLAVITEVTLKLHPIPKHSWALRVSFPSETAAAACARDTLRCGVNVTRCELLDPHLVRVINMANQNDGDAWPEEALLLYDISGISQSAVEEQMVIIQELAARYTHTHIYTYIHEKYTRLDRNPASCACFTKNTSARIVDALQLLFHVTRLLRTATYPSTHLFHLFIYPSISSIHLFIYSSIHLFISTFT